MFLILFLETNPCNFSRRVFMPNEGAHFETVNGNAQVIQVGGDMIGDNVAGNKTIINNIIQQAAKQIVTAPYKFLHSYDICDHDIFFGRDAVIEELLGKLPRSKALVINGRSGAGKTSLINAGLIPRLAENGYHYIPFREYSDPLAQLQEYAAQNDPFRPFADAAGSLAHFLKTAVRQHKMRLTLIFDQFERFFAHVPAALRAQFIQEVKTCLDSDLTSGELDLVFALREDFFGAFMLEFESAIPAFFQDAERFNLYPLRPEDAREAIIKPLKNLPMHLGYDLHFVDDVLLPGLIGESVEDARIDPPNLQIVCNQLYENARERHAADLEMGSVVQISRQFYEELGETRGILRGYLDDFIDHAAHRDSGGRDALRSMLKLMTETTGTRKFVSLADLTRGLPDVPPADIERHLRACQDGRIIETLDKEDDVRYSLSHDVMVAKVAEWFDERELQRKKAQETLERGLAEWKNSQTILTPKQVKHIRCWLEGALDEHAEHLLTESEQQFIISEQQRVKNERLRLIKTSLFGILLIGTVFIGIFGFIPRLFYQFDKEEGSNQIIMKQGHPNLNMKLFRFPKLLEQKDADTGYQVSDIENIRTLMDISFRKPEEKFSALIPFLNTALRGTAYEQRGMIDEAIRASIQAIRDLSGLRNDHAREQAALLLIRQSEQADTATRQFALDTLAEIGRGYALRELKTLEQSAVPAVADAAKTARQRIEARIAQTMIRIPAGEFVMGIQTAEAQKFANDYQLPESVFSNEIQPTKGRIAQDFLIDRYEVTNEEYLCYLNNIGRHYDEKGTLLMNMHEQDARSRLKFDGVAYRVVEESYRTHPATMVSWYGAEAYCQWMGKRLPTETEWERAARGIHGHVFPWGNIFKDDMTNTLNYWAAEWQRQKTPKDQQRPETLPVGSFEQGCSPDGLYDMAGNVWEWTDDIPIRYPESPVNEKDPLQNFYNQRDYVIVRGGAFDEQHSASARSTTRFAKERNTTNDDVGFRCVFDLAD